MTTGCADPQCGIAAGGRLRSGWVRLRDTDGTLRKWCPEHAPVGSDPEFPEPVAEPEPPYQPSAPPRPRVQVTHEPTPPEGATCSHEQCGATRGRGHPPEGWVRLWVTGPRAQATWFCSVPCAVVALAPMVRLPLPTVERDWVSRLSAQAALDLLVAASGQPMTVATLTGWRVRRAYDLGVARLDPAQPGWLAHRARLAAARGRLLVECDEPKPSEIDDDLDDEELSGDPPAGLIAS